MSTAIRWSPTQLAEHNQRLVAATAVTKQAAAVKRFQALGRLPKGQMNKTEAAYAELLEQRKHAGQIIDYKFHPMNVRLADKTFYEIDFLVVGAGLGLEIHEVKGGFTTDKGQIKIKLCAEVLPWFRFLKVSKQSKKDGGQWKVEEF